MVTGDKIKAESSKPRSLSSVYGEKTPNFRPRGNLPVNVKQKHYQQ